METWIVVFLGIIALASLVQIAFLTALAVLGIRSARVIAETREQVARELREPVTHLAEAARNLKDVSQVLAGEAHALRDNTHRAAEQIRDARQAVGRAVRSPWMELAAIAKGVARGVSTFRRGPGALPETSGPSRAS
jgi:hypothetical protein